MTRTPRTKQDIENKIVQLYIKLHKRKTEKPSRRMKIKRTIEAFKDQLQKIAVSEQNNTQNETDVSNIPSE